MRDLRLRRSLQFGKFPTEATYLSFSGQGAFVRRLGLMTGVPVVATNGADPIAASVRAVRLIRQVAGSGPFLVVTVPPRPSCSPSVSSTPAAKPTSSSHQGNGRRSSFFRFSLASVPIYRPPSLDIDRLYGWRKRIVAEGQRVSPATSRSSARRGSICPVFILKS